MRRPNLFRLRESQNAKLAVQWLASPILSAPNVVHIIWPNNLRLPVRPMVAFFMLDMTWKA
jgi:hypothetical protein